MANDSLVEHDVKHLGGPPKPNGLVSFRRILDEKTGEYAIISFSWSDLVELKDILEKSKRWKLVGFSDVINLKVKEDAPAIPIQEPGPLACPYHGEGMKPSKKQGYYYCPKKLLDGSFCKHQVKL
jgi:hypothetical protein